MAQQYLMRLIIQIKDTKKQRKLIKEKEETQNRK